MKKYVSQIFIFCALLNLPALAGAQVRPQAARAVQRPLPFGSKKPNLTPAIAFLNKMVQDPLVPDYIRRGRFAPALGQEGDMFKFDLQGQPDWAFPLQGSVSIIPRAGNNFDLLCLFHRAALEASQEPKWEDVLERADAFVNRFYPELRRVPFDAAHQKPQERYNLHYQQIEEDVVLRSLDLLVNPGDGKMRSLNSATYPAWSLNLKLPPAVSPEKIIRAAQRALIKTPQKAIELQIQGSRRDLMWEKPGSVECYYNATLAGNLDTENELRINGRYIESEDKFLIDTSATYPISIPQTAQNRLPILRESDPVWDQDGKALYWSTSRNVDTFTRHPVMGSSIAVVPKNGEISTRLLRIFKPIDGDGASYRVLSASGNWLAVALQNDSLAVLDTIRGILYIPSLSPEVTTRFKGVIPASQLKTLTQYYGFKVDGAQWLKAGESLIVSNYFGGDDKDLLLYQKPDKQLPQSWGVQILLKQRGDDVLPTLKADGSGLAWAHQISLKAEEQWEFNVGRFTDGKKSIQTISRLPLKTRPTSIAYAGGGRWLVVSGYEAMWIQENGLRLTSKPVPPLFWDQEPVKLVNAAVSPDGSTIALCGYMGLETGPKLANDGDSWIFRWDGKSGQIRPWLEPKQTKLPRYLFPARSAVWAYVSGANPQNFLLGFVDPRSFIPRVK